MKLMVFCIDGMEPSIVFKRPDKFPFFAKLCSNGISAELLDTEPCGSVGKWFTFLTGATFHDHGLEEGARNHCFRRLSDIRKFMPRCLWNVLNQHGYSVGLANFYGLYPAPALHGFAWCEPQCLLSGKGTGFSESEMVYPRELVSDFDVRSYPKINEPRSLAQLGVQQSWEELKSDPHLLERALGKDYYGEFPRVTAKRADWTRERLVRYCKRYLPDVLFYYNWDLDKLQHFSWHEDDGKNILIGYSHVENLIQSLCEELQPENVLIFSDHGHASYKDLLQYDYQEVHPEMARFYEERDRNVDYVTFANGTRVVLGQNRGIVSGTHTMKGILIASGREIAARGRMPLVPFRYMHAGVLRLLRIEEGRFQDWETVDARKNWFEPGPQTIPAMFNELKSLDSDYFKKYASQEIELLKKICAADVDDQFLRFTVPCATRIGTLYFNNGMHDEAREWMEYALSLDTDYRYPHYSLLNLLRTAYLNQTQGKLKSAREVYVRLATLCEGTEDFQDGEETGTLQERVKELGKLVEERSQWAQSLERTIADERAQHELLRAEFEERTGWTLSLEKTVTEERAQHEKLRAEFEERTAWALALDEELRRMRRTVKRM